MLTAKRECAFKLSDDDFSFICQFVYDTTGIVLNEKKREMLYRRFTRIIRDRKLASFADYCQLLRKNTEQETDYFINAITTNLTSFFRENHHFDFLLLEELPRLIKSNSKTKRLRVWSCASSTGEEPYSIAITIMEKMKSLLTSWDIKILATDIDSNVLSKAKKGIYDLKKIENVTLKYKNTYFHRGLGENSAKVRVDKSLQSLLTFKQLNLLHEWPMKGKFDVIFCRNVIIYFDKETQQELFSRYLEALNPGGILILGHSENLGAYLNQFEHIGRTIYRKKSHCAPLSVLPL